MIDERILLSIAFFLLLPPLLLLLLLPPLFPQSGGLGGAADAE
jgi:hypothetical protein